MDKLREIFEQEAEKISKELDVIVLNSEKSIEIINSHIEGRFEALGTIDSNHIEAYLDMKETTKGLEVDLLLVYPGKDGQTFYFHKEMTDERAKYLFEQLDEGEEMHVHVKGKDYDKVIKKLNKKVVKHEIYKESNANHHTHETQSGLLIYHKNHTTSDVKLDEIYEDDDENFCIKYKILSENGLHARPMSQLIQGIEKIKTIDCNDKYKKIIFMNNASGNQTKCDSIMHMLLLCAQKDNVLTIYGKDKANVEEAYKVLKNIDS